MEVEQSNLRAIVLSTRSIVSDLASYGVRERGGNWCEAMVWSQAGSLGYGGEPRLEALEAYPTSENRPLFRERCLLDESERIAGCCMLATGQVDFSDLAVDATKRLPRRALPVAILAWRFRGLSEVRSRATSFGPIAA